jgi:hypothetical protein
MWGSLGFRLSRSLGSPAALCRRLLGSRLLTSARRYRLALAAKRPAPSLCDRSSSHRGAAASTWGSRVLREFTKMCVAQINDQAATADSDCYLFGSDPAIAVVAHDRDRFQSKPPRQWQAHASRESTSPLTFPENGPFHRGTAVSGSLMLSRLPRRRGATSSSDQARKASGNGTLGDQGSPLMLRGRDTSCAREKALPLDLQFVPNTRRT